jgi:hypothetical protein
MDTFTTQPWRTFAEETTDALLDKEGLLVMLGTADGTVKLATSGDVAIGVMVQKSQGSPNVNVRLLSKGGTVKVKCGGVIAKGSRVVWGAGGTVVTQPITVGTYRTLGRKLGQGSTVAGDIVEILDLVEPVVVP